jgi:Protein of unknown function (DUF1367)
MARLNLRKTLTGFTPADEPSVQAWKRFKLHEIFRSDIVKPRSYKYHKLAFALLNLTYENQEQYTSFEIFRKAVAIAAGHVDELIKLDGEIILLPRSINYDTLDEIEFTLVFGAMMTVCANILHDIGITELEAEVSKYCDQRYGHAA